MGERRPLVAGKHSSSARYAEMRRVLWIILFLNLIVAAAKIWYGTISATVSVRADGIASLFDSLSNLVGIVGLAMAERPADLEHPYGHQKFETYASAAIGLMLLVAAFNVGSDALAAFLGTASEPQVDAGSFAVMAGTLCINVFVALYERRRGRELKSEILSADALHTLSDVLVSISVIVGLVFIKLGFPIADAVASLVVTVMILRSAWEVFRQASSTLSDEARIPVAEVKSVVDAVPGATDCHKVRTRGTEGEVYMDLHILVDPDMTIREAHGVAELVEQAVEASFPQVVDIVVHVEPDTPEERYEAATDDYGIS